MARKKGQDGKQGASKGARPHKEPAPELPKLQPSATPTKMSTESASETKEKEQWADVQAKKSKSAKTDSDGGGGGKDGNKDGGGGGKGGSGGSGGAKKPHGKGKGESTNTFTEVRQFLKEVWIEFNKISWPDRQQVIRETWSVLFLVTVITVMVLGFDWVLGHVIFGPLEHWARMHGGGLGH